MPTHQLKWEETYKGTTLLWLMSSPYFSRTTKL